MFYASTFRVSSWRVVSVLVVSGTYLGACQSTEPRTDAERLVRGREIIQRMSDKLGSTPAFTVTTTKRATKPERVAQIHDLRHIAFANTATLVRIYPD